ncbi:iron complex transport system ATP-binding protein [Microbacterium terrae]|uniref:Siderophore transport system ATP-binding protein YusV n=1 Tax=Microbacterium terrae TaxID=69369 RepID=A0A0M2GWH2_9MICO|nr:ABC transporter ATP-binding protein [Microbacterium terrae]KJL38089.1 putative siderophore transport system ATP-binding protein YusV [Microbacterium terrae]MBP1077502.1 iron complex transport system ATP-binding protein [Microbacterium terrae]GLJ99107.1 iron-dicitrate ABC transporter ATP-binding protein [Microbacterium terrae]
MTPEHQLHTDGLVAGYGGRVVVDGIDVEIPSGAISVIVGANACGKSTLLKTISRLIPARSGAVVLDGKRIDEIPTKELARTLGLLPQQPIAPEGIVVADLVGRGRHPHQKMFRSWTTDDDRAVAEALTATGVLDLADRSVDELSGGQRQRVWIAMALAQETDILLLDEPTTFLDVSHQIEVLDLLTDLNQRRGTTIVMVLHDINLAARYADRLFALRQGRLVASGAPADILTSDLVREVFDLDCLVIADPVSGTPIVLPRGRHHVLPAPTPTHAGGNDGR